MLFLFHVIANTYLEKLNVDDLGRLAAGFRKEAGRPRHQDRRVAYVHADVQGCRCLPGLRFFDNRWKD